MNQGKAKCELLKEIRSQIAAQNGIDYATSECVFKGDCKGTCPKCEAELKFIENQLFHHKKTGKSILISGITAGIITTMMSSCHEKNMKINAKEIITQDTVLIDLIQNRLDLNHNNLDTVENVTFGEIIIETMGDVPPEFELKEIDFIEEIPDPLPFDSVIYRNDTL
jgi:periplasmic protein TonB